MFENIQLQQKKGHLTVHHTIPESHVEGEKIKNIITTTAISTSFSLIGIDIVISQTHRFSERKTDHNWKSRGKHD